MWRETTKHERNRKIWQEEFADFIPPRVLDFHVHVFNAATVPPGQPFHAAGHPLAQYSIDDLRQDLAETYPGRETAAVCFGLPFPIYNRQENNRYVAAVSDHRRFFPLRLLDPHEKPADVRRDVLEHKFLGFKPYLDYVGKSDPGQVEIHEMMPAQIMRIADELGLLVMLHIPRRQRLADPLNQRQIVELCTAWPRAKIILAHVGRAYYIENIVGRLDRLKDLPNLYFDLAMLNNWEVLEYLFQAVAAEKIIYATDVPCSLAPGKSVEINDQYTYVTPVPWDLSISDEHGKLVFTSFVYEELRAVKKAVQRLQLGPQFVEDLFFNNAMRLLKPFMKG